MGRYLLGDSAFCYLIGPVRFKSNPDGNLIKLISPAGFLEDLCEVIAFIDDTVGCTATYEIGICKKVWEGNDCWDPFQWVVCDLGAARAYCAGLVDRTYGLSAEIVLVNISYVRVDMSDNQDIDYYLRHAVIIPEDTC